jgi:hypothetical protein
MYNGTEVFVDPINCIIKSAGLQVHCNDVAPPWYKLEGKWYLSYPELKVCQDAAMLPVNEVQIKSLRMSDIGFGKSIYTKKQLCEFAAFQDSQSTRRAYSIGKKKCTGKKNARYFSVLPDI